MIKVQTLFYILLSIFPLMTTEFLPMNLVALLSIPLFLRVFFSFHRIVIFAHSAFTLYFIYLMYGKSIIPESMISFLATMCLARMLEKDKGDEKINRYLGILWAATFVLFRSDLTSILVLTITIFFILKTLPYPNQYQLKLKQLFSLKSIRYKELILGFSIVVSLFLFFPRVYNFLPSTKVPAKGQIGYSKTIDNSSNISLTPSSQTAFYAQVKKLPNDQLYWRGRVHSYTDGYNWRPIMLQSRLGVQNTQTSILQYSIKYEQDFDGDLILLDLPYKLIDSNLRGIQNNEFHTFKFYNKKKKAFVKAQSLLDTTALKTDKKNLKHYLQLPEATKVTLKKFATNMANSKEKQGLDSLLKSFENYITNNKFTYTLNPKDAKTLKDFLKNKQGFCTHYASLLALTLRYYKFPARIVSGFQGGQYNEIGEHYKVSSNDAHAWVEVFDKTYWKRIDPTSFVAPNRVLIGGEGFFTGQMITTNNINRSVISKLYFNTLQYWENINYKVGLFFDTYDRESQSQLASHFKMTRKFFIGLGFTIITLLLIFFYVLTPLRPLKRQEVDRLFYKFVKKLKAKNILIQDYDGIQVIEMKILSNITQQNIRLNYLNFLKAYEVAKYSKNNKVSDLKRMLKNLK